MLRKGSETAVHAAGFGLAIRGLRPSDTSGRVLKPSEKDDLCQIFYFLWKTFFYSVPVTISPNRREYNPHRRTFRPVAISSA